MVNNLQFFSNDDVTQVLPKLNANALAFNQINKDE